MITTVEDSLDLLKSPKTAESEKSRKSQMGGLGVANNDLKSYVSPAVSRTNSEEELDSPVIAKRISAASPKNAFSLFTSKNDKIAKSEEMLRKNVLLETRSKSIDTFQVRSSNQLNQAGIKEYLQNVTYSLHDKLSFLMNNIHAKALFRAFLVVEYQNVCFYFLLWEQLQNAKDYFTKLTPKENLKTASLLYKRHFSSNAPLFIQLTEELKQRIEECVNPNKDIAFSLDLLCDIESFLESKHEKLINSFSLFLSKQPIDTLQRKIFGCNIDFYLPLDSKLNRKESSKSSTDEIQIKLLYILNEMATSSVDEKKKFIEENPSLKKLWLLYIRANEDNQKIDKMFIELYDFYQDILNKKPKEAKANLKKYYAKYVKEKVKFLELTPIARQCVKTTITESKKTDILNGSSLSPLKKELDICMYLLIRGFIFDNFSAENFEPNVLQKNASIRRKTYTRSMDFSNAVQLMSEEKDVNASRNDQELLELVSLTQRASFTSKESFPITKLQSLKEHLQAKKIHLKDKLLHIIEDNLFINLLEMFSKSQFCYESLVLYNVVINFTSEIGTRSDELSLLIYIYNTFIQQDGPMCVTLTASTVKQVNAAIVECKEKKLNPGSNILSNVFQELAEFFYTIINDFSTWIGEAIEKGKFVTKDDKNRISLYQCNLEELQLQKGMQTATRLEYVLLKEAPNLFCHLCDQILTKNNIFKVNDTRLFWLSTISMLYTNECMLSFIKLGTEISLAKGTAFEGDSDSASLKINKQSSTIFIFYLLLYSSAGKQLLSKKEKAARQKDLQKKKQGRDEFLAKQKKGGVSPPPNRTSDRRPSLLDKIKMKKSFGMNSDQISNEFGFYLQSCVTPVVQQLINNTSEQTERKNLSYKELNVLGGKEAEMISTLLSNMFKELAEQVNMIPVFIRKLLTVLRNCLAEHFVTSRAGDFEKLEPVQSANIVIGNLWNDFLQPLLESPQKYGILEHGEGSEKALRKSAWILESLGEPQTDTSTPLYKNWMFFIESLLDEKTVDLLWENESVAFNIEKQQIRQKSSYISTLVTIFEYLNTYKVHIYSEALQDKEITLLNEVSWEEIKKWLKI